MKYVMRCSLHNKAAMIWRGLCVVALFFPKPGPEVEAATSRRGSAAFSAEDSGSLYLTIDGKPFLQNSYIILGLPNSNASLWSVGKARDNVTIKDNGSDPVQVWATREIAGAVRQEVMAVFSSTMLVVHWRLADMGRDALCRRSGRRGGPKFSQGTQSRPGPRPVAAHGQG